VREYIEHRIALARDSRRSDTPGAVALSQALAEWSGPSAEIEFTPDAIEAILQFSGGLPRVINLLCDRSLEQAHVFRLHAIDGPLIHMAARALGIHAQPAPAPAPAIPSAAPHNAPVVSDAPSELFASSIADKSPRSAAASEPGDSLSGFASSEWGASADAVQDSEEARPAEISAGAKPLTATRMARGLALAASVVIAAAIWFGVRATHRPAPPASSPAAAEPEPTLTIAPALPETTPATRNSKPAATPAPPEAAAAAVQHFDIVVASFRTDARAETVAAQVSTLGLPVRRRVADSWQQIICGPFTSRTDAEQAQQRLEHSGLTGTQIVPAAR
jgi:cell division septation protein DedD